MDFRAKPPEQVLDRLAQATIAITNKVVLRAETLVRLPKLKMIAGAASRATTSTVPAHSAGVANKLQKT